MYLYINYCSKISTLITAKAVAKIFIAEGHCAPLGKIMQLISK